MYHAAACGIHVQFAGIAALHLRVRVRVLEHGLAACVSNLDERVLYKRAYRDIPQPALGPGVFHALADVKTGGGDGLAHILPGSRFRHGPGPEFRTVNGQAAHQRGQVHIMGDFIRDQAGQAGGLGLHHGDRQSLPPGGEGQQIHGLHQLRRGCR